MQVVMYSGSMAIQLYLMYTSPTLRPEARPYRNKDRFKVLAQQEKEKTDGYLRSCHEMQKDFMPLVYSVEEKLRMWRSIWQPIWQRHGGRITPRWLAK